MKLLRRVLRAVGVARIASDATTVWAVVSSSAIGLTVWFMSSPVWGAVLAVTVFVLIGTLGPIAQDIWKTQRFASKTLSPILEAMRYHANRAENARADARRDRADADAALLRERERFVEKYKIRFVDDDRELPSGGRSLTVEELDRMIEDNDDRDG